MNGKYVKAFAMALMCAFLLGNLPTSALAAQTPGESPDAVIVYSGDWVVTTQTRTNDMIYCYGNVTIPAGVTLTLVNSTIFMNCATPGEHYIDVSGTLIMQHGGLYTPMNALDFDASRITSNDTTNRPYFRVKSGATFTATNSIVEYMGIAPFTAYLTSGNNPETNFNEWLSITNGSFRIAIDGVARDIADLDFSAVTSMDDVAAVVQAGINAYDFGGFATAGVGWLGANFAIVSGTVNAVDGLTSKVSSVSLLGTHSTGAGVDISGLHNRSGANTWWLDCALNATATNCYPNMIGPYMQSNSVSISNCLIQNNQNGLIFDSVYPATLQNNNVTGNTGMGLLVSNITNPNFALPSITLSNNNFINNGMHGVAMQASTIGVTVFNVNASGNDYGLNFYSKGDMTANVHDCVMWDNSGGTHNHATALLLWTGPTGKLTGTVEHNDLIENSCGGLWAGYQFGGTASYDTTLLIRNNTFVGNDGKETFQAINNLNVKVYDNYFGGSDYLNHADGMRIGFRHGDTYDFAPADTFVRNLYLVVANNIFNYGNYSDGWDVGGAVLTAARVYMDATVTGNTVWGGYQIGGLFKLGWPHPYEACEGDPRFKRVDTLKASVTDNEISIWKKTSSNPTVGGTMLFFAEDSMDIVCSDNKVYTEGGQMGTIIGVEFGAGWAGDLTVPCRNVKATIERNEITENITQSNINYFGGMIRVLGLHIQTFIRDNILHRVMNGTDLWDQGNNGQQGSPWIVVGSADSSSDESNSRPVTVDATITGNELKLDMNVTPTTSTDWHTGMLIRLFAITTLTANVTANDILINTRFNVPFGYLRMGSAIRMHSYGTVDAKMNYNNIIIKNKYIGTATGYFDLGGIIRIGSMDPVPQYVNAQIIGNVITFHDNSTSESTVGSVIRIHAMTEAKLAITDNKIYIKSYKAASDIDIGEVFRVWKCVDDSSDFNVPQSIEMDLHRNNVQIFNNATSSGDGGGGIMRLHGLSSTVLRMTDNVFQYTTTNPSFDNDTQYDMGVRVGYHCYQEGILSRNVDVTTSNNVIGPGGVGGAMMVAGNIVNLNMNGDKLQKARYGDCGDMGYYSTEFTYGNGLVLLGDQINATIRNVQMINNEGAGLYVDTTGDANLFLDNCRIYNNSWHGVYTKGFSGLTDMGRVNNTRIQWNGNDTNADFGFPGNGAYAVNSKITFSNCTFNNPNATIEFNVTDTSFVTALNTQFNSSRVTIAPYSYFLRQWFMNLKVEQQSSGAGIPFADVSVDELLGTTVYDTQVGMDGWMRWVPMSQYIQDATTTTTLTAHTVTATKGAETDTANPTMTTNRDVVIILNYVSQPPVADAGADQTVNESTVITLDGSASTDDYLIVNWTWTCTSLGLTLWGDVVTFNVTNIAGVHNVTLTVTDIEGYTNSDYVLITVVDATNPVANAGPDQTVDEDTLVTFDGSGSSDNLAVANYTWSFAGGLLYGVAPTYTFTEPGVYLVILTVADAAGHTATDNVTITVLDVTAPAAAAGAGQVVAEGATVTLSGAASSDNVGIVSYTWTFNDGANAVVKDGVTITHVFRIRGNYTVTLTCEDAAGNVGTANTWVRVEDQTAPKVMVVAPGESLTNVPIDWELIIVFDEPMDNASVEAAMSISGGITITDFTWDATNRYVTLTLSELAYDTTYTLTVGANATDVSGNTLGTAYTASFTSAAAPEEPPEPETNFFTDNWWILVVVIVVLAVLLLVSLLRGGKKEQPPAPMGVPPAPPAEQPPMEPAPEELPPENQ